MSLSIHQLRSPSGARKNDTKRLGRGPGSGQGKTAGKGHKGQLARAGRGKPRIGFEGGQNTLLRRLPKFGFNNIFRVEYMTVSLEKLSKLETTGAITPELLKKEGLISHLRFPVKVLGSKEFQLSKKLHVQCHSASASAKKAIEAAGGKFEELKRVSTISDNK